MCREGLKEVLRENYALTNETNEASTKSIIDARFCVINIQTHIQTTKIAY